MPARRFSLRLLASGGWCGSGWVPVAGPEWEWEWECGARRRVHKSLKSVGGVARACTYYSVMNGDILAAFDFTCKASSSSIRHTFTPGGCRLRIAHCSLVVMICQIFS